MVTYIVGLGMNWFDEYPHYAESKAKAAAWQRKHVEKLKAARAGKELEEIRVQEAYKPVTSEIKETKQLLGHIKDAVNLQPIIDRLNEINLKPMTEQLDAGLNQIVGQLSKLRHPMQAPPSAPSFDVGLATGILNKHKLPHPKELENYDIRQLIDQVTTTSKVLGGKKHGTSGEMRREIDIELEVLRKYKELLQEAMVNAAAKKQAGVSMSQPPTTGYGAPFFYKCPKELENRLRVLFGEMRAGNVTTDIQNEAIAIIDRLQDENLFEPTDSQALYEKVYSF